jgi:hypothetical protein
MGGTRHGTHFSFNIDDPYIATIPAIIGAKITAAKESQKIEGATMSGLPDIHITHHAKKPNLAPPNNNSAKLL